MRTEGPPPHGGQAILLAGASPAGATAAAILLHGRGGTSEGILDLGREIARRARCGDVALLAPQAEGEQWYPYSFLAPIERNEPELSSALAVLRSLFRWLETEGPAPERVILAGFSQGACLALEFAAREARRYGGVVGLSGGLIGPPGTPRSHTGSLHGTPIFLGCSDRDPHVPAERLAETARALAALGAQVDERIYPGMDHTVNEDELDAAARMMEEVARRAEDEAQP